MEKKNPHTKLAIVRALIESGQMRVTRSAIDGALALGVVGENGICQIVMALDSGNFYKSMTSHADHTIWHDVYRTTTADGRGVYLKLIVMDGVLVVSFKEL